MNSWTWTIGSWVALAHAALGSDISVIPGQSIQAAIVSANPGDRILVQPGAYFEAIDFLGKSIEVIGVGGAAITTIDATGTNSSVVRFENAEPASTRLRGFTLRGGVGTLAVGSATLRLGGGVLARNGAHPTLEECAIRDNTASSGGGIHHEVTPLGATTLVRCVIASNQATLDGGGAFSGRLLRCSIRSNFAVVAGGGAKNPIEISDSVIDGNSTQGGGGGVSVDAAAGTVSVVRSRFVHNHASAGGGIFVSSLTSPLSSNSFFDNTANEGGGALIYSSLFVGAAATVTLCSFAGNHATLGSGVSLRPSTFPQKAALAIVNQCSFAGDSIATPGAQLFNVVDSIVFGNASPFQSVVAPNISSSIVPAGYSGFQVIHSDPRFVAAITGDLHLEASSPAIGLGIVLPGGSGLDYEGDVRGAEWDIGVDEFARRLYVIGTPTPGAPFYFGLIGAAGSSPLMFLSATLASAPAPTPYGGFELGFPLLPPSPFVLPPIPSSGALLLPNSIPAGIPTPIILHAQAFLGAPENGLTNPVTLLID